MADEKEIERASRLFARAKVKRTTIISQIRAIHAMALRVQSEPDLASEFLLNAADLDALWFQFRADDDSVLDLLSASDKLIDYSPDLIAEVRQLINSAKNIAQRLIPTGGDAVDLSYLRYGTSSVQKPREDPVKSLSRLPDIPLPTFEGDYRSWPNFRDRFSALVDKRHNLSNIDKMYYLIGCLKGAAADAVLGIPVSADNYELVMNTLSDKFNRPRLVATSLVDKLLQSSAMTQESLNDLNAFVGTFSESISLLDALKIPDTGSFILFSIAFRCLPVSTRKLFEANSSADYPSIGLLLDFLRSRVAILEVVGESHKSSTNNASFKWTGQFRKGGEYAGKPRLTSLVTSRSNSTCPCCAGSHALASCSRFKNLGPDERSRWTREKKLCFNCFSDEHWAPKCNAKSSCQNCTRKHHSLLHHVSSSRDRDVRNESPAAEASLRASVPRPLPHKASSIICRHRAGWCICAIVPGRGKQCAH